MLGHMGVYISILRDIHWERSLDLHWEAPLKEFQDMMRW